jgi:hypothetical protein
MARYFFPGWNREVEDLKGMSSPRGSFMLQEPGSWADVCRDLVLGFFPTERERGMTHDPRELTKGRPRKSTGVGWVMGVHWPWGGSLWVRVVMAALV